MAGEELDKKVSLEEKIIKDIEKSGYPLEIYTTSMLETKNWCVINQDGYLDVEEGKWRTVDISAFKRIEIPSSPVYRVLHLTLIIECKNSEKPWVFWTRDKEGQRLFELLLAFAMIKLESRPLLHPLRVEKMARCLHYYFPQFNKVAFIFYEAFKNGKKEDIFEAKNQVIKALTYKRREISETISKLAFNNIILIFYPLIIFDGPLYELELVNEKPKLNPSQYIQYFTSHGFPEPEMFIIDVVRKDYLHEYLEILENEIKRLTQALLSLEPPTQPPP